MLLTDEQYEKRLALYQENWQKLAAVDALIEDLTVQRREIRAEQTRIANQLVKDEVEARAVRHV